MAATSTSPIGREEAAEYYFTYIDKVPPGDIRAVLRDQLPEALELLRGVSEERSLHRYGPEKWSIRELVGHVNDCERLFTFRAMWFARGIEEPLPSFDQDVAAAASGADARSWKSHVEEFEAIRRATVALFDDLPEEAWSRGGKAIGHPVTVRALAYITAGHVEHHLRMLRDRYL